MNFVFYILQQEQRKNTFEARNKIYRFEILPSMDHVHVWIFNIYVGIIYGKGGCVGGKEQYQH